MRVEINDANTDRLLPMFWPIRMPSLPVRVVLETIKWKRVIILIAICFCRETTRNFVDGNPFVRDSVNLYPIACPQQQGFGTAGLARDRFGCGATRELLSRCHVRSVMAQSDTEQVHGT
jgi:hypothetical protein